MGIFSNFGLWGAGWTGWIIPFLFGLSVVVFFHELGHFLVARWCGVRVLTFSVGFGPELVGFNDRYGTRWKISAIPLGGYVKFFGDENAASVPDEAAVADMTEAETPRELLPSAGRARASAIVAAGPIANFILAIVIFAAIFALYGRQTTTARVDTVQPDSAAAAAGSPAGRRRARDRRPHDRKLLRHAAHRQRQCRADADVPDRPRRRADDADGDAGAQAGQGRLRQQLLPRACWASAARWRRATSRPSTSARSPRSGSASRRPGSSSTARSPTSAACSPAANAPISSAVRSGSRRFPGRSRRWASCRCCISPPCFRCRLACLNLFPVPLLDGGHLLFYGIEAGRGRPLSARAQEIGFRIGFAIVVMLMIFTVFNDTVQLLPRLWAS